MGNGAKMITVFAYDTSFGNAHLVKKAFSVLDDTALVTFDVDPWRSEIQEDVDAILMRDGPEKCQTYLDYADKHFLIGASSLKILDAIGCEQLKDAVIWYTDSPYLRQSEVYDGEATAYGVKKVFAMPDLMHLAPEGTRPLLHPIKMNHFFNGNRGDEKRIVAHSPGDNIKRQQKGSDEIESAIINVMSSYDLSYRCIMHVSHRQCLEEKAQAHIFIDKLVTVDETCKRLRFGLGKSGLEAMALGCVTMCAMHLSSFTDGYFDRPPVVKVNEADDIDIELRHLIEMSFDDLEEWGEKGQDWIAQYWGLENGAWLRYYENLCNNSS